MRVSKQTDIKTTPSRDPNPLCKPRQGKARQAFTHTLTHVDRVEDGVSLHVLLRLLEVAVQPHRAEVHVFLRHVERPEQSEGADHLRINGIVAWRDRLREVREQLRLLGK